MIAINLFKNCDRVCTGCKKVLSENQFQFRSRGIRRRTCKTCDNERSRKRFRRDPEKRIRRNQRVSEAYHRSSERKRKKAESGKRWRERHPDLKAYMDAAAKRSYQKHLDRRRAEARQRYWQKPEERRATANRKSYKIYGLSEEDFLALEKKQGGVCAICLRPERRKIRGRVTRLSVDHCHKTGRVRGLLCSHCNSKLSLFEQLADHLGIEVVIDRLRRYLGV